MMVVLVHRNMWIGNGLFFHGFLAVDFFFMLSGFVIAYAYGERLKSGAMTLVGFVGARVLRLWPLVVLGVSLEAVVLLLSIVGGYATTTDPAQRPGTFAALAGAYPLALLNLPVPGYPWPFVIDNPRWSLFYEMIANLGFAFLVPLLGNRKLALVLVSSVALTAGMLALNGARLGEIGPAGDAVGQALVRVWGPFVIGVGLHRWWASGHMPRISLPFWLLAGMVVVFLSAPPFTGKLEEGYVIVVILGVFPAIVIAGCQSRPAPRFARLAKLGATLSYPLYILHLPVLHALDLWRGSYPPHARFSLVAYFIVCCAVAWAAAKYYDTPVRRWLGRRFGPAHAVTLSPGEIAKAVP